MLGAEGGGIHSDFDLMKAEIFKLIDYSPQELFPLFLQHSSESCKII